MMINDDMKMKLNILVPLVLVLVLHSIIIKYHERMINLYVILR